MAIRYFDADRISYNVIAQTKGGDPDNVVALGGHSDSVAAGKCNLPISVTNSKLTALGPGINDDGSGTVSNLVIALALSKFSVNNAVRFAWWTGEEFGLLGSTYYVESLNATEVAKIKLYLNFDMIASPNYVYAIYDGDGSAFGISGPTGSAQIEALFESYYASQGLPSVPTEFNGRSDYGPFLDAGVPAGGLFTGAEEIKTDEEAALFGGTAGIALDANYHGAGDNVSNLALDAFEVNSKASAWAVATYALSLDSLYANVTTNVTKRSVDVKRRKKFQQPTVIDGVVQVVE